MVETSVFHFEDLFNCINLSNLKLKLLIFSMKFNNTNVKNDYLGNLFNFIVNKNYLYDGLRNSKSFQYRGEERPSLIIPIFTCMKKIFRYIDGILVIKKKKDFLVILKFEY